MLFDEGDAALLKKWIVKRLEDISDADSDVLADYVLALLRHEQGEEDVKQLCVEQLDDFLRDHTITFVNDVFSALKAKSFLSVNSTLSGTALHVSLPQPPSIPATVAQDLSTKPSTTEKSRHQSPPLEQQQPAHLPITNQQKQYSAAQARVNNYDKSGDRANGKKRPYFDRDRESGRDGDPPHSSGQGGNRSFKAPRRGNERGGRWSDRSAGRGGHISQQTGMTAGVNPVVPMPFPPGHIPALVPPPIPSSGFPWTDDPMAAFLAVQAAAGWAAMPGFSPVVPPPATSPTAAHPKPRKLVEKKVGERCKDYDEKGYCMQGDMCPYEHGVDHIVIPGQQDQSALDEYDPNNAQIFPIVSSTDNGLSTPETGGHSAVAASRGRGQRGSIRGGRGGRSDISHTGPNFDKSNTILVVEHIPDDKLNETSIRDFFSVFGNIMEVEIQGSRKLATVKFERWDMAKKAYDSPEPIFNNRFVKVFWYKPSVSQTAGTANHGTTSGRGGGHAGSPTTNAHKVNGRSTSPVPQLSKFADETEDIDMEEFARKQEERQKAFEDKMAKKRAHDEALKELERKKEDLLRMEREQKTLLMEKLAKKGMSTTTKERENTASVSPQATKHAVPTSSKVLSPEPNSAPGSAATSKAVSKEADPETERLRAQLEALEAEAKSLGIEHSGEDASYRGRGRGRVFRGASRGRAGYYNPYYAPYTPAYRGRAGFPVRGRGGPAALKLDNRTKKVAVKGISDGDGDEALRQYLLQIGEFESITPHPDSVTNPNTQLITFKDRPTAEKFVAAGRAIPGIGAVEISWVHTALLPVVTSGANNSLEKKEETEIEEKNGGEHVTHNVVEDYDVAADDEGRWLAE